MTVMHTSSDVADKSVSTEDASELVHLDAILAALVENKVEAIKAASSSVLAAPTKNKWGSVPISPERSRLTSSSTVSSSQNHFRHHHEKNRKYCNKRQQHHSDNNSHRNHKRHRHRRYDSAPCENFIETLGAHDHPQKFCRGHRRASEMSRNSKKKRRNSQSAHALPDDMYIGFNSPIDVMNLEHDLAFINIERPQETLKDNEEYPGLHQSAYLSQSATHVQIYDDDEDYAALDLEDELDISSLNCTDFDINEVPKDHYRRPRRKRKRKHKRDAHHDMSITEMPEVILVDHDELPSRARWTIVATACLLFAMSIILVGVTLRMAPIIDDMVRKENEELLNSLNRDTSLPYNASAMPL